MIWESMLWGNTYYQYLILILWIVGGIIVAKLFYKLSSKFIRVFTTKTKTQLDDILINELEKPVVFLIFMGAIFFGVKQLTLSVKAIGFVNQVFTVVTTISIAWVIINLLDSFIQFYLKPVVAKSKSDLDDHLLPMIRRLIKIVVWIVVIIMLIKNFGIDVSALLTGAGLGGLAFALAAQDMLSNLFGGISILADKPFKVGDRIKVGNNDGFVKEIGLRTTRMKTFNGTHIIIPNSEIANTILENVSKEKARRMNVIIGVEYGTPQKKMREAEKIFKEVIKKNKHTKDDCIVSFKEFGDSSLNIQLIYWIKDLDEILKARHEINLWIKERFEKAGIEMAFPTRTVHMINATPKPKSKSKTKVVKKKIGKKTPKKVAKKKAKKKTAKRKKR